MRNRSLKFLCSAGERDRSERLQAVGLSVEDVVRALERMNENAGGEYIERHREQLVIGDGYR